MRRSPTPTDPFATLNEQQLAAVNHGGEQPLLVMAGAGSGKTLTLACRVARLVLEGADPQRILLLTFSRRAAQEMARRSGQVLRQALKLPASAAPPQLAWAGTFHSVGARLLRDWAPHVGLNERFAVLDCSDAEDLMALVRQEGGYAERGQRFPLKDTCVAIYSQTLNRQASLNETLISQFPWCAQWQAELKQIFAAYTQAKQRQGLLDYDDLLLYWWQALGDPALAAACSARFSHVLVDEYQDTNRLQAAIVQRLKPSGAGLMVVGDDAQAIYAFRGAEVRNILDFAGRFTPPARTITLERNYRSTQAILDASNAVIALAHERHAKQLWTNTASPQRPALVHVLDDVAQATWVAEQVLGQREEGLALKDQAVLFRTGSHSAALELELARRHIPFVKFGGLKFLEAAHVKDLLALLRFGHSLRHELAGFRALQLVPGIGAASARRLLATLQEAGQPLAAMRAFKPPPAAARDWPAFAELLSSLCNEALAWPADLAQALAWYLPQLHRRHDDAAVREADLQQLQHLAAGFGSRERFLTELALDPPEASSDWAGEPLLDEDYLVLSTLHSAKGQEWKSVSILNVVDGCIPSDMATGQREQIEEERRLLYVGMTRARQHLQLLVPQRFYPSAQARLGDRHVYGGLSRFIAPPVAACFEHLAPAGASLQPLQQIEGLTIDLPAQLRGLWA